MQASSQGLGGLGFSLLDRELSVQIMNLPEPFVYI
jgi:hypothetical protein